MANKRTPTTKILTKRSVEKKSSEKFCVASLIFLVSVDSLFSSKIIVWSYSNSESVHRRHQTCRPRLPTNLRGFPPRINPERSSHVKRKRRKFISTLLSCAEPVLMVQKTISKLLLWEQKHINFLSFSSSHKYSPIQKAKKKIFDFLHSGIILLRSTRPCWSDSNCQN